MAEPAQAATTDNSCDLDVLLDTSSNPTGVTHTLTATVEDSSVAPCEDLGGYEVDFEIESGPAARVNVTGDTGVGGTASDDGNSPATPDLTCTAPDGGGGAADAICTVTFTSDTAGTHVIRAWVDDDKNNATSTTDMDTTEGRNPGTAVPAGGDADDLATGAGTPGDRTEADDTDVVEKVWFTALAADAKLDCTPETATNPSTGDGSSETYTCDLWRDTNSDGDQDAGEADLSGFKLDAENCGTANDPDDTACTGTQTADYNDAGTTAADGTATVTVGATEGQAGTVNICIWVDSDADNVFAAGGTTEDGEDCDAEALGEAETVRDTTDIVQKVWVARGVAAALSLSPGSDQNIHGTSHTVTATVVDAFGDPVVGAFVDFGVTGHNTTSSNQVVTNASGQASFTYTDTNADVTEGAQDTISACVDNNNDHTATDVYTTGAGCDTAAMIDTAVKFWFTVEPTASSTEIDMLAGCPDTAAGGAAADKSETNFVAEIQAFCASAYGADGNDILGETITFTTDLGFFVTDVNADGNWDPGVDTDLGQSTTATTDSTGDADVLIVSTQTGTSNITATADAASDTSTEIWTADTLRNLTCVAENAQPEPGTTNVITCTATDRWGNPTADASGEGTYSTVGVDDIVFSEAGTGRFDSADTSPTLDANGQVEVVVSTTDNESGTQTITAENLDDVIDSDLPADLDDACDQAEGTLDDEEIGGPGTGKDASEAPTGNCETTVELTWEQGPPPVQCEDGVDNDGDGFVDFPNDPGCADAADNDESNEPTVTNHARTAKITKFRHIDLPGKKKPALQVKGKVTVDDAFDQCANQVPVKIQLRASGQWITRKSDTTNENGRFSVLIRDVRGRYRAVAPRVELADEHGDIDNCLKAKDTRRHRH